MLWRVAICGVRVRASAHGVDVDRAPGPGWRGDACQAALFFTWRRLRARCPRAGSERGLTPADAISPRCAPSRFSCASVATVSPGPRAGDHRSQMQQQHEPGDGQHTDDSARGREPCHRGNQQERHRGSAVDTSDSASSVIGRLPKLPQWQCARSSASPLRVSPRISLEFPALAHTKYRRVCLRGSDGRDLSQFKG